VEIYPILPTEAVVEAARQNEDAGVMRFSLVTSGRKVSETDIDKFCEQYRAIQKNTQIHLCASMGLLGASEMRKLREAGVERYHCNLETGKSFFPKLCSTHTTEQKKATMRHAMEAGMEVCSGGIIGMGESMADRIEMAIELRELGVKSVPVNLLNPIAGTALENAAPLSESEILATMAIYRFLLPDAFLRFAGGRINMSESFQKTALKSGMNACIVGTMLTTQGPQVQRDFEMFRELSFQT
jgi:biotin synthase